MDKLMKIILALVLGSMALSVVGTVFGLAVGLVGLVLGLAVPFAVVGGLGAMIYYLFKRGFENSRKSRQKTEPMEQVETEVVEDFQSFFTNRQG